MTVEAPIPHGSRFQHEERTSKGAVRLRMDAHRPDPDHEIPDPWNPPNDQLSQRISPHGLNQYDILIKKVLFGCSSNS